MKKLYSIVLILFISTTLYSQNTQTLRGRVIDAQAQIPLIGVNIQTVGLEKKSFAVTDVDGYYAIPNIPIGRNTIKVTYVGYEEQIIPNVLLEVGKQGLLNVALQEQITSLKTVAVTALGDKSSMQKGLTPVSAKTFDVEETRRYAGGRNDIARMAAGFAGVNVTNDSRNDIIIRGNSPAGLLWRMEGVDIPNPNHFGALGVTGGPVSMLNNNVLANSSFLTGAFPALYGNATAGVFDLEMRNGNSNKREYLFQAGFAGLEAGAEGYFKEGHRASYMVNYRYTMTGILNKAFGINFGTGGAVPLYQDLTFKVNIPTKKLGTFSIFGIGGLSNIEFKAEEDANFFSGSDENLSYSTNTGIVGINHTYFFSPKTYGKLTIAATKASVNTINDEVVKDANEFVSLTPIYRDESSETRVSFKYLLNHKVNPKNNFSIGTTAVNLLMNYADSSFQKNTESFRRLRNYSGKSWLIQSYANWQLRPTNKLTMNFGLYGQQFLLNNTGNIEPRFGMNWNVGPRQSVAIGLGRHSQLQALQTYFNTQVIDGVNVETNRGLEANISDQAVISFSSGIAKKSKVKLEAYYQSLSNIPVDPFSSSFSNLNMGSDFTVIQRNNLVNEGTGENYGLELTLERAFDKYYYMFTGSFFESTYKGSDGVKRNTFFNGNYVINFLSGREFKIGKKAQLALDTKITSAGGKRFTPILIQESIVKGETIRDENNAFEGQFKDYFRTDFKITLRINHKKVMEEWFVDFQNLTNNQNVFWQNFDASSGGLSTTYQLGFFPNFNYRLQF